MKYSQIRYRCNWEPRRPQISHEVLDSQVSTPHITVAVPGADGPMYLRIHRGNGRVWHMHPDLGPVAVGVYGELL